MGFVGVLLGIKSAVEGTAGFMPETVPADFPGNENVFTPFTFDDYVTALQAERICEAKSVPNPFDNFNEFRYFEMTGMPFQGNGWQVPMLKCDPRYVRVTRWFSFSTPVKLTYCSVQKLRIGWRRRHEIL